MAIQFLCPSCRHPIEVDDEWSGHNVACPFCRNTVTAPEYSTYKPSATIPTARTIEPDPTTREWLTIEPGKTGGNLIAVWAFALSCLSLAAWIITELIMRPRMVETFGPNPTQQQIYEFLNQQVQQGSVPRWLVTGSLALAMSLALWVAGLVCAVLGLRKPARRGFVLAAFALLSLFPIMICAGFILAA